jgi:hypothetical protein
MWAFVKAHPVMTGVCVVCAVGGAALGPVLADPTWSLGRQIAAGTIAGLGSALIVIATRLTGAFAPNIEDDARKPRD